LQQAVRAKGSPRVFRHRGTEMSRIEALSDAVFAFSVSLLVASLEVPQTFKELKIILQGAIPFFATVSLLFLLWYQQYIFFRHYAMNDLRTIILNLIYLAVIVFYIYPLKFLFSLLISSWTHMNLFPKATEKGLAVLDKADFLQLVIIFSAGYFVIWLMLYLMHRHASKTAAELSLSPFEKAFTQKETRGALWNALTGLSAIFLAFTNVEWLPGICYLFIPVLLIINEQLFRKKLRSLRIPA
jgi:uncharacterized membrane protein